MNILLETGQKPITLTGKRLNIRESAMLINGLSPICFYPHVCFVVDCRWNQLPPFWILKLCFINLVSKSQILQHGLVFSIVTQPLSLVADPRWYPARQSLRLDPSASQCSSLWLTCLWFICVMVSALIWADGCRLSQKPSVFGMRRFCRRFLWEPRPAFTSATSGRSSHGEPWVHTRHVYHPSVLALVWTLKIPAFCLFQGSSE